MLQIPGLVSDDIPKNCKPIRSDDLVYPESRPNVDSSVAVQTQLRPIEIPIPRTDGPINPIIHVSFFQVSDV